MPRYDSATSINASQAAEGLTLKSLRTLAAVDTAGSLTRAAIELGLAQSAVSRHLSELERALGGALFHRTGRGVQRTELAAQLLPRVAGLLAQADALALASRELRGTPAGLVTLGLVPGVAGPLASALHGVLARQCPEVRLRVIEGYSGDMETALTQGRIDLAVLNRYRNKGANTYRRLFDAQLCVVGRRPVLMQALSGAGSSSGGRTLPVGTTLQAVARLPLVLPVPPNAIRNLLDEVAQRQGQTLNILLEGGSSVIIKRMLRDHACASVLPAHAVADELASGALHAVPLQERAFRQHVMLATSSQRPFTLASKAVAKVIADIALKALHA
jgi:LysR family transcriptional regulator, nitrogen assimilation regulatory protein